MKKSSVIHRTLFHLFHLCSKRAEGECHKLEALKTEGNSDYRHTAKQACEKISRRKLPAGKYHPDDICDRMLIKMCNNGLSKRRKRKPSRLKALFSKGNSDNGYRQQYTGKKPIECRKKSPEQNPDKIT
jgi:hypothetical protein